MTACSKPPCLTPEQAAIISAYTGFLIGDFSEMHKYAQRVMGRPIWIHEFARDELVKALHEASRADFLALDPAEAEREVAK